VADAKIGQAAPAVVACRGISRREHNHVIVDLPPLFSSLCVAVGQRHRLVRPSKSSILPPCSSLPIRPPALVRRPMSPPAIALRNFGPNQKKKKAFATTPGRALVRRKPACENVNRPARARTRSPCPFPRLQVQILTFTNLSQNLSQQHNNLLTGLTTIISSAMWNVQFLNLSLKGQGESGRALAGLYVFRNAGSFADIEPWVWRAGSATSSASHHHIDKSN